MSFTGHSGPYSKLHCFARLEGIKKAGFKIDNQLYHFQAIESVAIHCLCQETGVKFGWAGHPCGELGLYVFTQVFPNHVCSVLNRDNNILFCFTDFSKWYCCVAIGN